ncbi:hypothetical protein PRIPAC_77995 [Pristionchus pacificus]|uniref:Uncharacterized protein n=1 Tax=Pristionchus pacificus TaxID=54126 RepID=A0A2A6CLM6_PRIPA|nr:hypothetical protein PRIPAC_77995 [Pristionchus pacificus]|eukprot:PDM79145.1 hypothetical protein PRIPAC_31724 [Pristionchus pacificus]
MTSGTMPEEVLVEEDFKLHHVSQQEDNYLAPEIEDMKQLEEDAKKEEYKMEYVWVNVGIQIGLHLGAFYGLYLSLTDAKWQTNLWMIVMTLYAGNSITAGAHRMWCHKSYKANFWVRLFYLVGTTMSIQSFFVSLIGSGRVSIQMNEHFQNDVIEWARDHRVKEMGKKVDMSDLEADPLLAFQRRHYVPLIFSSIFFLTAVPHYCWGESWNTAYFVGAILRLALQLHGTWFINSAAHTFGYKPFDTKITAVDTFFYACLTNGEAWHNYHHTFPQDYRASEYMWKGNMSAAMIDFFAYMGWVWDRKTMSKEAIERQKMKGDQSRPLKAAHNDEDDFDYITKAFSVKAHHD